MKSTAQPDLDPQAPPSNRTHTRRVSLNNVPRRKSRATPRGTDRCWHIVRALSNRYDATLAVDLSGHLAFATYFPSRSRRWPMTWP